MIKNHEPIMERDSAKMLEIKLATTKFLTARVQRVIHSYSDQMLLEISLISCLDRKTIYKIKKGREPVRRSSILRLAIALEEMGRFGEMPAKE